MKNIDLADWLRKHGADHAAEIADELDRFIQAGGDLQGDWKHEGFS